MTVTPAMGGGADRLPITCRSLLSAFSLSQAEKLFDRPTHPIQRANPERLGKLVIL
jgi:hypothetical protein